MLIFWLSALLLIAVSLALLLPVFWGRYQNRFAQSTEQNIHVAKDRLAELKQQYDDQQISDEEYQQQRNELEQTLAIDLAEQAETSVNVLGDKKIVHVLTIVFLVPVVSFALYFVLGSPQVLFQEAPSQTKSSAIQSARQQPHSVEEMLQSLEQKLVANPDNIKGWMMLGRSYMSLDRFDEAAKVYAKITKLFGETASILLNQADALAMMQSGRLAGKPIELVHKALKLNPDHTTGLWLAGLSAQENGHYEQAITYWRKAEMNLATDPGSQNKVRQLIQQAEMQLGKPAGSFQTVEPVEVAKSVAATNGLRVKVSISAALKTKTSPDDVVFIFAKAAQGPRMPLAIVRKKVSDLPVEVMLTDQQAMMPNMAISKFDQVKVSARISFSGQAIPQSGDLAAEVQQVSSTEKDLVAVIIEKIVP